MGLVILEEFLQMAKISEAELRLEIAILLFQQEKITLGTASQFAHDESTSVSAGFGKS